MPHKKFVLFDFDGVIADSYSAAFEVSKRICHLINDEEYKRSFEGNVNDWKWDDIPGDHSACDHSQDWFSLYIPTFETDVHPKNGIDVVIETLAKEYVLIVISSTITSPIQGFLERYHLGRYFSEVMGNDVHTHKDKKIQMVFDKYKTKAEECVFVTDSLGDMREAEKMDVGAIGVSWGWHSQETLAKGNPFRIVDVPAEIQPAITDYFAAK